MLFGVCDEVEVHLYCIAYYTVHKDGCFPHTSNTYSTSTYGRSRSNVQTLFVEGRCFDFLHNCSAVNESSYFYQRIKSNLQYSITNLVDANIYLEAVHSVIIFNVYNIYFNIYLVLLYFKDIADMRIYNRKTTIWCPTNLHYLR